MILFGGLTPKNENGLYSVRGLEWSGTDFYDKILVIFQADVINNINNNNTNSW